MDTKNLSEKIEFLEKRIELLEGEVHILREKVRDTTGHLSTEIFDSKELFDEAVAIISKSNKATASLLQSKLNIGYARAARLLDELETKGYVSEAFGQRPRKVLIKQTTSMIQSV